MFPPPMTPEAFVKQIAEAAANSVLSGVKTLLSEKPPQWYDVTRQTQTGPVQQKVQLPQMLAELTDTLKVNNALLQYLIGLQQQVGQVTESLAIELEEVRKMSPRAKKSKRKFPEDEEEV